MIQARIEILSPNKKLLVSQNGAWRNLYEVFAHAESVVRKIREKGNGNGQSVEVGRIHISLKNGGKEKNKNIIRRRK